MQTIAVQFIEREPTCVPVRIMHFERPRLRGRRRRAANRTMVIWTKPCCAARIHTARTASFD